MKARIARTPRRWPSIAAATLIVFILTPTAATAAMHPLGHATTTDAATAADLLSERGVDMSDVRVTTIADMRVSTGFDVTGYVDFWDDADTINMRPRTTDTGRYADNLLHEFGHIAQKRLVEKASPAGWWQRTANIAALDEALRLSSPAVAPRGPGSAPTVTPGLEANADCIAVTLGGRLYRTWYVQSSAACTPRDLAAARSVLEGDWPSKANIDRWAAVLAGERKTEAVASAAHRPPATCRLTVGRSGLTRICP